MMNNIFFMYIAIYYINDKSTELRYGDCLYFCLKLYFPGCFIRFCKNKILSVRQSGYLITALFHFRIAFLFLDLTGFI